MLNNGGRLVLRPEAAGAAAGRPLVLRPGGRHCWRLTAAKRTPASRFAAAAAVCRWERAEDS